MKVRRLRTLWFEICKTLNDLNPNFMNNIFKSKINGREVRDKYKLNLDIPKWNQKTYGYKNLKVLGQKIWINLPYHVKSSGKLDTVKNLLKIWDGNLCKCNLCKKWYSLKSFIPQYYLFSLFYFYIGSFLLNIIYIKNFFHRITCKNVQNFFLFSVNPSLFLKFQFTNSILTNNHFINQSYIFRACAMSWMELFETIVNGLSFLD